MKIGSYELGVIKVVEEETISERRGSSFQYNYCYTIKDGTSKDLFHDRIEKYSEEQQYNNTLYSYDEVFTTPNYPCVVVNYAWNRQRGMGYNFKKLFVVGDYKITEADKTAILAVLDYAFK